MRRNSLVLIVVAVVALRGGSALAAGSQGQSPTPKPPVVAPAPADTGNGASAGAQVSPLTAEALAPAPKYAVLTVVNATTIKVSAADKEMTVRLLGVDPLTAPQAQSGGQAAPTDPAEFLKGLLQGQTVCLEDEPQAPAATDDGGRWAYVYRMPDALLVNAWIVHEGYARLYLPHPNKYRALMSQYEKDAQAKGRGNWPLAVQAASQGIGSLQRAAQPGPAGGDAAFQAQNEPLSSALDRLAEKVKFQYHIVPEENGRLPVTCTLTGKLDAQSALAALLGPVGLEAIQADDGSWLIQESAAHRQARAAQAAENGRMGLITATYRKEGMGQWMVDPNVPPRVGPLSEDEVRSLMGPPRSSQSFARERSDVWYYGAHEFTFKELGRQGKALVQIN